MKTVSDIIMLQNIYFLLLLVVVSTVLALKGSDFSLSQYTNRGEVAQITYAGRFVSKCMPAVGFTAASGRLGILMRVKRKKHPLLATPLSTISTDHGYAMCVVGLDSDCSRVKRDWQDAVESDLFTFGEIPSLQKLSSRISAFFTKGLYREEKDAITRPLAASVLVIQKPSPTEEADREARLRVLYNTGSVVEGVFGALGSISEDDAKMEKIASEIERSLDEKDHSKLKASITRIFETLVAHIKEKGVEEPQNLEMELAICSENRVTYGIGDVESALAALISNIC